MFIADSDLIVQSHSGVTLATVMRAVIHRFKIHNKIMAITGDNASNNLAMVRALESMGLSKFRGEATMGRCAAHIVNLVVKAVISPLKARQRREARDPKLEDFELAQENVHPLVEEEEEDEVDSQGADNDGELGSESGSEESEQEMEPSQDVEDEIDLNDHQNIETLTQGIDKVSCRMTLCDGCAFINSKLASEDRCKAQ
jgi:hypothetical protein